MTYQCHAGRDNECSKQDLGRCTSNEEINDRGNQHQDGQLHGMEDLVKRDQPSQSPSTTE